MRSLTVCVMLAASGSAHGSAVHLLEEAGPAAPDHTQAEQLGATLARFDPRVLKLLGGQGVRIGIARQGVALADLQIFKARSGAEDLGALRELAGAYQRAARPFDHQLQKLHGQLADLGPVQLPEYVLGQGPPRQPEFHRGWVQRRKVSYDRAVHGQTVSDYARRSPSEYSAEGVAHVFDPQMASEDSGLYDLTRELLERATR